jgi:3-dehydroquinate synthase
MHTLKLNLGKRSYRIIVGNNIIGRLGKYLSNLNIGKDAYVITNARIKNKHGNILNKSLRARGFNVRFKTIPDTEKSKSIRMLSLVINDLARYDKDRRIFIISFGGGVVGDLGGFIAAIYKRGIPYIQVPTTLLAQVDSSIGGKTAIDLAEGKNLVGAFYQPRLVFSDVNVLKTLSPRQIRAGLSEVIKYAIIKDKRLFSYLENNLKDILALRPASLEYIIKQCSSIKAKIVQQDEREERLIRTILNFGHTIGHAIEAASRYKIYNHGEAIALGMLIATDISKRLKLLNDKPAKRIENLIKKVGLPTKIKRIPLKNIIEAHYRDKKFIGPLNRFVLTRAIGRTKIVENIPIGIIKEVIKKRQT